MHGSISDAAIAEMEAGIYGLQVRDLNLTFICIHFLSGYFLLTWFLRIPYAKTGFSILNFLVV